VYKAFRVMLALLVSKAITDLQAQLALKEHKVFRVKSVQQVYKAIMAQLALPVLKAPKVFRGILAQLALKVRKDFRVSKVMLAQLVLKVTQAQQAQPVFKAISVAQALPALPVPLV
jgi:hypothetical protein